jgi:hypothetical protein
MKKTTYIFATALLVCTTAHSQYRDTVISHLNQIKAALDTSIFVSRFESTETPCVYIDASKDREARANRQNINSDYRIQFKKNGSIDTTGTKCLSQYCSRYLRFRINNVDNDKLEMSGTFEATYAYPASSLIQYLGFTNSQPDKTNAYFNRLLRSEGNFFLYPEDDKYKVKIILLNKPYDSADTVSGYIEIVREAFRSNNKSVHFYFDEMNLHKGDRNNQISLKFSSTSFFLESQYFQVIAYHVLKYINSPNEDLKKANAIWLKNFLVNPACSQCKMIYNSAMFMVRSNPSVAPNTEPNPPH